MRESVAGKEAGGGDKEDCKDRKWGEFLDSSVNLYTGFLYLGVNSIFLC